MPFDITFGSVRGLPGAKQAGVPIASRHAAQLVQDHCNFPRVIRVYVAFEKLASDGGRALSQPVMFFNADNFTYPTAILKQETKVQSTIDPQEFQDMLQNNATDIRMIFCTRSNWYIDVDGRPCRIQEDLVRFAMHELHDGLGWDAAPNKVVPRNRYTGVPARATRTQVMTMGVYG